MSDHLEIAATWRSFGVLWNERFWRYRDQYFPLWEGLKAFTHVLLGGVVCALWGYRFRPPFYSPTRKSPGKDFWDRKQELKYLDRVINVAAFYINLRDVEIKDQGSVVYIIKCTLRNFYQDLGWRWLIQQLPLALVERFAHSHNNVFEDWRVAINCAMRHAPSKRMAICIDEANALIDVCSVSGNSWINSFLRFLVAVSKESQLVSVLMISSENFLQEKLREWGLDKDQMNVLYMGHLSKDIALSFLESEVGVGNETITQRLWEVFGGHMWHLRLAAECYKMYPELLANAIAGDIGQAKEAISLHMEKPYTAGYKLIVRKLLESDSGVVDLNEAKKECARVHVNIKERIQSNALVLRMPCPGFTSDVENVERPFLTAMSPIQLVAMKKLSQEGYFDENE